ncbi:hypothetical protein [Arthrobacter sp. OAP107]|uniref:hypothetical protein n=1 Tax=Arthrobacter sp. OAP107 TaxID=3156445 RepID=UPI003390E859
MDLRETDLDGVAFASRHGDDLRLWTIFERPRRFRQPKPKLRHRTDEEARDKVLNGAMGRIWGEYNIPTFVNKLGIGDLLCGGAIAPEDLTVEWMVDNFFIVGSPDTVIRKIENLYNTVGGFGSLVSFVHEYSAIPSPTAAASSCSEPW